MRHRAAIVAATFLIGSLVALAACAPTGPTSAPPDDDPGDAAPTPAMMAAAVHQLLTVDHTFGEGPPPFTEYLLLDHTEADAPDVAPRPLTDAEQAAIEEVVAPFGPFRWIDDPAEWRTEDLRPTIEGAVIVGVGEPTIDGDRGLVPVSLWCGGLCGTWLTYELTASDGDWAVTGIDGPIAVS
ncbi:MAG: hypothetical protein S0880_02870 [Actinomycetota bacterium]|nr:hypothetical protein [Actinomycetota bacterium]